MKSWPEKAVGAEQAHAEDSCSDGHEKNVPKMEFPRSLDGNGILPEDETHGLETDAAWNEWAFVFAWNVHVWFALFVFNGERKILCELLGVLHEILASSMGRDMKAVAILHDGVQFVAEARRHLYFKDLQIVDVFCGDR